MIERESEAWRKLAEYQDDAKGADVGLCWHAGNMEHAGEISEALHVTLTQRLKEEVHARHRRVRSFAYYPGAPLDRHFTPCDDSDITREEADAARVLACLMFAEEAESEGR